MNKYGHCSLLKHSTTTDHNILRVKLYNIGIRRLPWEFIISYLKHRKQSVKIGTEFSDALDVTNGIPQGAIFITFINYTFENDLSDELIYFAEDTVIIVTVKHYNLFPILYIQVTIEFQFN